MAKKNQNQNNPNNKDNDKFMFIFVPVLVLLVVLSFIAYSYFENKKEEGIAYNKLLTDIQNQKVEKIEMETTSNKLKVIMKGSKPEKDRTETANVPSIQAFMEWINDKVDSGEVDVELVEHSPNQFVSAMSNVVAYIPTILLVILIVMVIKMQGLGGDSGKKEYYNCVFEASELK